MCRSRAIFFFQCVLVFFMNSQFSFSAAEVNAQSNVVSSCPARCVVGDIENAIKDEEVKIAKVAKVAYYFLESRKQFIKHSAWISCHVLFTAAMYSAGFYYLYSASLNGLSEVNNMGMTSFLMFLGPIGLVAIGSTACPLDLARKTKEKAKRYLVEKLGQEVFYSIKELEFNSVGVSGLIGILNGKNDKEQALEEHAVDFLKQKLEEHEKQEKTKKRCCVRARGDRLLLEGE